MTTQTVLRRQVRAHQLILTLPNMTFEGRRFLPVGENDEVRIDNQSIWVHAKRENEWIDITEAWTATEHIQLGPESIPVTIKEIETATELRLFQSLKNFHYRGGGGAGRTVPLIGVVDIPDLPRVIGFVEISSSLIANTARKKFFDSPYSEPSGLHWNGWDRETSLAYSNLFCRISRFVIHPELRGLGIASCFTRSAKRFAQQRWHFGGLRPRFLEITADMLRYYPFVGRDFEYMGETEGNEHRVSKDMNYLVRKALSPQGNKGMPQGGGGIMTLQRSYAVRLLDYMRQRGASLEETVSQLQFDPAKLDQETWEALYRLNRKPKPTYVSGLTNPAREFVTSRALQLFGTRQRKPSICQQDSLSFRLTGLRVEVSTAISQTTRGRTVQDAFGFVGAALTATAVGPLDLVLVSGQTILICGASGSGKSLLLNAIETLLKGAGDEPTGSQFSSVVVTGHSDRLTSVATVRPLDASLTPLEALAGTPLAQLLEVTAKCGLAEPQLLVRPIHTLSSGQRYRLDVAAAFLSDAPVILIDNFCEPLDRYTALAVCRGVTSLARELNKCVILATAAHDRVTSLIEPEGIITLRRGDDPVVEGVTGALQETADHEPVSHPIPE